MNRPGRRAIGAWAVGATLASALAARQAEAAGARLVPGVKPLPAISFTDAEGAPRTIADFPGRALVLNFWATWCPPCVAEMPALDRLHALLKAEGVSVLALSSDRGGRAVVEAFYARTNLAHLGIWLDPRGTAGRTLGVRALPTTVFVNREGHEVARAEGAAEWDQPPMLDRLRALLLEGQG